MSDEARSLSAWPTPDEVRERFEKSADRIAFDRMIAEVERAAAARALEEAADEIFVPHNENRDMSDAFRRGADAVYDALRARAAEIRGWESK